MKRDGLMVRSSIVKYLHRLRADQRGAVSVMMGVLMVPLIGALAIGFEVSNWYMTTRGMQNAADAATLAAATKGGANIVCETQASGGRTGDRSTTKTIRRSGSTLYACSPW